MRSARGGICLVIDRPATCESSDRLTDQTPPVDTPYIQYPFLYFSLHTEADARVLLESEARDEQGRRKKELSPLFGGVGIPGSRLDFRFDHKRDQGRVVLSEGRVTFKEVEMRKVDPLGIGGVVNVGDVVDAGGASLTPVLQAS